MKRLFLMALVVACTLASLSATGQDARAAPSISITSPTGGWFVSGELVPVTWNLSDDFGPLSGVTVWVNFTGPTSGPIAGPIAGILDFVLWTIPSTLNGTGFRVIATAVDAAGTSQSAESPEFTLVPAPKAPTFGLGASGPEFGVVSLLVASGFLVFLIAAFGPALAGRVERGGVHKVRAARRTTGLRPIPRAEWEARKARGEVPAHSRSQYGGGRYR